MSAPPHDHPWTARNAVAFSAGRGDARVSWAELVRAAWASWGTHALALADQAVVSGTSFLTTVMIGHSTVPNRLGLYAIGISLLVSLVAIQDSLITLPYTIRRHRPPGTQAEHAGSSLAQSGLMAALCVVLGVVSALSLAAGGAEPELVAMIWALAAVLPFALLREFGRRFAFARLQMVQALMLDLAVAVFQIAALFWLGWTGRMSAAAAIVALGAACALTGAAWLYLARAKLRIRVDQIGPAIRRGWELGKWLFASQITVSVQGYATHWLLAFVVGTTATGVYAACMSVVLFANPLIMGLGNILAPKAALAMQQGGGARLREVVTRDALVLGAALTLFCAVILVAGEDVMRLLYHGKEYEGNGQTVTVLALAMLASAVGMPASNALASMEQPKAIAWVGLFSASLTVGLVWWLVVAWGLLGAACGFLAGNLAGAVGRWVTFLVLVGRDPEPAEEPIR
jgi:O-antigen/teichoic acid export membrane protein